MAGYGRLCFGHLEVGCLPPHSLQKCPYLHVRLSPFRWLYNRQIALSDLDVQIFLPWLCDGELG